LSLLTRNYPTVCTFVEKSSVRVYCSTSRGVIRLETSRWIKTRKQQHMKEWCSFSRLLCFTIFTYVCCSYSYLTKVTAYSSQSLCFCDSAYRRSVWISMADFDFIYCYKIRIRLMSLNPLIDVSITRLSDLLNWRSVNRMTESFVYHWLRAHATFNVKCFPAFVGASDVISSVLSIR